MWHRARARTGSERSRLQPPSAVSVASRAWICPSSSKPRTPPVLPDPPPPLGVEAVPLAAHGEVLGPVEPEPDRAAGQDAAERGDRGEAVRLHLLAAEAAAHAQALNGHLVAVQPEHVRHDLLGLRGVLGAALHEDL